MSVSGSANTSLDEDNNRESLSPYLPPYFLDRDFHLEEFAEYRASNALYKAFTPCCLALGLVGNCGSVVVLLCGRMPRSTTFTYMVALATVMVTVAMTTERYLMIKYALKASYLFTIRRARMAVGTVTVVALKEKKERKKRTIEGGKLAKKER
ncbi:hypothetical protein C0Q70_00655 [Pomacea canaliculata]|uniref:G-protein coupled receptors family 1 profile domain-containing protein n=1 Tax=Pomacea canaliculata TaxID=400727 RepID=A0A2T7PX95_POMCA|nr:hypothetical protein C0Q70_00655 [Pomacea canaliculata]